MKEKKHTRWLLAEFTEVVNRHGPQSRKAEEFIAKHSKNKEFVSLARIAAALKIALTTTPRRIRIGGHG